MKPVTYQRYRRALFAFTTWAADESLLPITADDWGDALLEYRYDTSTMSKSKFAMVVAALELFLSQYKAKLPWSRALLSGWARNGFTQHAVPLTSRPAFLVATLIRYTDSAHDSEEV